MNFDHTESDLNVHARPWIPGATAVGQASSSSQQHHVELAKMRIPYAPHYAYPLSSAQLQYSQPTFMQTYLPTAAAESSFYPQSNLPYYRYPSPAGWGSAA
jgi:hypothetical protein